MNDLLNLILAWHYIPGPPGGYNRNREICSAYMQFTILGNEICFLRLIYATLSQGELSASESSQTNIRRNIISDVCAYCDCLVIRRTHSHKSVFSMCLGCPRSHVVWTTMVSLSAAPFTGTIASCLSNPPILRHHSLNSKTSYYQDFISCNIYV